MRFSLILTLCLLFFTNCKDECLNDNVKLGDISFADETSLFLEYYSTRSSISFENTAGETKQLNIALEESNNPRVCVTVLCRPDFEVDGSNGCEYYDVDDRQYTLVADDIVLELNAGIDSYIAETELFYDYVQVGLTANVDTIFAGLVSSSNFTSPILNPSATILSAEMSFMENDTLGGYENVWVYLIEDDESDIYFILDQSRGIVEYKYDNQTWTLVE